MPRTAAATVK
uniref:Uncharacterized protein n=1 Tax=Arundo donax TaxID=35708 RepID=A0A0A9G811_ARUDO